MCGKTTFMIRSSSLPKGFANMKSSKHLIHYLVILPFLFFAAACSNQQQAVTEEPIASAEQSQAAMPDIPEQPASLPVMYQQPAYIVDSEIDEEIFKGDDDSVLKVGATIKSTRGPQPLWDILKRLAALKKMNVSWASDVDQNVLVDVDISANDDFYLAIDNLLRQVDYFHVMKGNTIVVKYKEVKNYRIAMPFVKSTYKTGTGGDVLGSNDASTNIDGTIELKTDVNEFDIWANIQENMDTIIALWNTEAVTNTVTEETTEGEEPAGNEGGTQQATRQVSNGGVAYTIDKPIGIITVTAPRPLQLELERYFNTLKTELYKQISIEAKVIEVMLEDESTIGINWNSVLKNFQLTGNVTFGAANDSDRFTSGQVWPYVKANEPTFDNGTWHGNIEDATRFVSKIAMDVVGFDVFLNALEEQGDTQVLSNPKISVMNGQPALITVGENVTYIEEISVEVDKENNSREYTVETSRILSGIGLALTATILDDNEIIMNLVPVTSDLTEPIRYENIGTDGMLIGLPRVNVREMSTTVKVRDNEMLIIGGLIDEINDTQADFLPILGDIPVVRYLFGYEQKIKRKRELIILLKPRII
ncbi:MAG: pilus (MSHA type) biogenesis protein MshL [Desulfobacterales bacterium]|nr:MAG: pilus (MSHA type) biogenesis protein MshL [Desulfobacterales bacterium]